MAKTSWAAALCLALLGTAGVSADTLIFRDGRRVDGELIAVNGGTVEFRERRGRGRVMRVDREVGKESTDLFFIGADSGPIRVQTAGRLFLGVNDDYFQDNHGNFRV